MNTPNFNQMTNLAGERLFYPDLISVPSDYFMETGWDFRAVSELIRSKCIDDRTPAFLFLGMREAAMLKEHLAEVFGEESVVTLNGTYYQGLNVKTIRCESFFAISGSKANRGRNMSRHPADRDGTTDSYWQFRS